MWKVAGAQLVQFMQPMHLCARRGSAAGPSGASRGAGRKAPGPARALVDKHGALLGLGAVPAADGPAVEAAHVPAVTRHLRGPLGRSAVGGR